MKTKNVFVYTESYYCRKFTAKNDEAPEYFTLETVFIHAAQIAASQCILHLAPPKWNCFLYLWYIAALITFLGHRIWLSCFVIRDSGTALHVTFSL